jgi:FixJ family two-component response regulator
MKAGYAVEGYTDAEDAISRLQSDSARVDLVCTDLTMPGTSGLAVARRIRDLCPHLPVVLVSCFVKAEVVDAAKRLGAIDLLSKPDQMDSWPVLVQEAFRRARSLDGQASCA